MGYRWRMFSTFGEPEKLLLCGTAMLFRSTRGQAHLLVSLNGVNGAAASEAVIIKVVGKDKLNGDRFDRTWS